MTADNSVLLGPVQEGVDGDTSNSSSTTDGAATPSSPQLLLKATTQKQRKKGKRGRKINHSNIVNLFQKSKSALLLQPTITQLFSTIKKSSSSKNGLEVDLIPKVEKLASGNEQIINKEDLNKIDAEESEKVVPLENSDDVHNLSPGPVVQIEPEENLTQFIPSNVQHNLNNFLDGQNPNRNPLPQSGNQNQQFLIKNLSDIKLEDSTHFHLATQIGIKFNQKTNWNTKNGSKGKSDFWQSLRLLKNSENGRKTRSRHVDKTVKGSKSILTVDASALAPVPETPQFELAGEWSHPTITERIYICNVCGSIARNWWENVTHKGETHGGGVVVTHVEINKATTPQLPPILGGLVLKPSAIMDEDYLNLLEPRDPLMPILEKQVPDEPPLPPSKSKAQTIKKNGGGSNKSKSALNSQIPKQEFLPYKCTKCSMSFRTQPLLHHHIFQCSGELEKLFSDGEIEDDNEKSSSPSTSRRRHQRNSTTTKSTDHQLSNHLQPNPNKMKKSSKKIGGLIVYNYYQQEKFKNRINEILSKERERELEEELAYKNGQPKNQAKKRRKSRRKLVVRKYNGKYNK